MPSRVGALSTFLLSDLIGSVIRFPLWWYAEGLVGVARWIGRSLAYRWRAYAITLWIRHFFVPMYGAHDWASRLISIVMRGVVIMARLVAFFVESLIYGSLLIGWFFLPVICLLGLLLNVSLGLDSWFSAV